MSVKNRNHITITAANMVSQLRWYDSAASAVAAVNNTVFHSFKHARTHKQTNTIRAHRVSELSDIIVSNKQERLKKAVALSVKSFLFSN